MLKPNENKEASNLVNEPHAQAAPFLTQRQVDLGEVPGDAATGSEIGDQSFIPQSPHNELLTLRASFPFVPIIPFPSKTKSYKLTAGTAADIQIPDGTAAIMLRGNGDYHITHLGNADVPTGTTDLTTGNSIYKPEGFLIYVGNIHSFSAIADVDCILSILCFPKKLIGR